MLVIAQAQGVKISGRRPKLDDFLPDYAKPKKAKRTPQETEAALKAAFKIIARQQPPATTDGQST